MNTESTYYGLGKTRKRVHQVAVAADDSDDAGDAPPAQRARPPPLPEPPGAPCATPPPTASRREVKERGLAVARKHGGR